MYSNELALNKINITRDSCQFLDLDISIFKVILTHALTTKGTIFLSLLSILFLDGVVRLALSYDV